jgi:hypothetical protein
MVRRAWRGQMGTNLLILAAQAAAAACLAVPAGAAEAPAIVTLVEGPASLLRGTARFALAEGVRLQAGDVLELADQAAAQVEFADATAVSLGPRSRFHVASFSTRGSRPGVADCYLLQGWSKLALGSQAAPLRLTTPHFGLGTTQAIAVVHVETAGASVFVETGEVRLSEGFARAAPGSPVRLHNGDFYTRKAQQKGDTLARPPPAFLEAMPRQYFDDLPARAARHRDADVAPQRLEELGYADVEAWLKGPLELRRPFVQRLRARAGDPAFRKALIANMRSHPEWDRILFPEKYKPKPPPQQGGLQ